MNHTVLPADQRIVENRTASSTEFIPSERIRIGNASIHNLTMEEAVRAVDELILRRQPSIVVTPNVDHIVTLETNGGLQAAYDQARLVLADGMPLLWTARLFGTPLKAKVSGSDLFPRLCHLAAEQGYKLFFLGGRPGAAQTSADKLRDQFPQLEITTYCPPMGFERDERENEKIVQLIRDAAPDLLFVGLGSPKQEIWMLRHHEACGVPVAIGIGASFEFMAGFVRRAPVLFQRLGFEWLWRLACEPRRMFQRYVIKDSRFAGIVWRQWRSLRRGDPAGDASVVPEDRVG